MAGPGGSQARCWQGWGHGWVGRGRTYSPSISLTWFVCQVCGRGGQECGCPAAPRSPAQRQCPGGEPDRPRSREAAGEGPGGTFPHFLWTPAPGCSQGWSLGVTCSSDFAVLPVEVGGACENSGRGRGAQDWVPKMQREPHLVLFPPFPEGPLSIPMKKGVLPPVPSPTACGGTGHWGQKTELMEGEGSPNSG